MGRRLVISGGRIRILPGAEQRAAAGGALVRPLVVGICGTDLDIIRRVRPETMSIIGHEGCARVESAATGWPVEAGDRVVFNPVNPRRPDSVLGHSTPGLLQESRPVAADESHLLVAVPAGLSSEDAALAEPLATAVYASTLVRSVVNPRCVIVFGAGSIGVLNALYASMSGAESVLLVDRDPARLEWAISQGIVGSDHAILAGPRVTARVRELTAGHGVDASYICLSRVAALGALECAVNVTRDEGCIDLVSGFPDGTRVPQLPGVDLNSIRRADTCGLPRARPIDFTRVAPGKRVALTGHRGTSTQHISRALELLGSHGDYFRRVVTHRVALSALPDLLAAMTAPGRDFESVPATKVLVDMVA